MEELPKTPESVVNNLRFDRGKDGISYENDIGLQEDFGLSVSAELNYKGENVVVLGSVVIEDDEPVSEEASFYAYPDGMAEDAVLLLEGEDAIKAAVILYDMRRSDEEPFKHFG